MDAATVEGVLTRLNCAFAKTDAGWQVQAPLARFDLNIEEDLIEELARVRGYDSIPAEVAPACTRITQPSETSVGKSRYAICWWRVVIRSGHLQFR